MYFNSPICNLFQFIREKIQLSETDMAQCLGISECVLIAIENGAVRPPSEALHQLEFICGQNAALGFGSFQTLIKMELLGTGDAN